MFSDDCIKMGKEMKFSPHNNREMAEQRFMLYDEMVRMFVHRLKDNIHETSKFFNLWDYVADELNKHFGFVVLEKGAWKKFYEKVEARIAKEREDDMRGDLMVMI
jgi:hypothetical protein